MIRIFHQQLRRRLAHALNHDTAACAGLRVEHLQQAFAGTFKLTADQSLRLANRLRIPVPPDVVAAALAERKEAA